LAWKFSVVIKRKRKSALVKKNDSEGTGILFIQEGVFKDSN
jgi:hypothetical protein